MQYLSVIAFAAGLAAMTSLAAPDDALAKSHGEMAAPQARGLLLPYISPARGRALFASKGCVVCHAINGIGGEDATPLDAADMPAVMNPFDFAARMWRGAATMIEMQEDELGEQIEFNGDELADIIAFVHSTEEQKKFSKADIPPRISELMAHLEDQSEAHRKTKQN